MTETSDRVARHQGFLKDIPTTVKEEAGLLAAIVTAIVMFTIGKNWLAQAQNPLVFATLFLVIFAVMMWAAFTAVRHADSLAEILGEPLGTLILTLSVICIEVSVISAVMLAGTFDPTLPRDTMLAVLMIVLNVMVGGSLLIGGIRYRQQDYNLQGARTFTSVLITLVTLSLVLPTFTVSTDDPSLTKQQAVLFSIVTVVLYGAFLAIQTTRHRSFFMEPGSLADDMVPEHGKYPAGLTTRSIAYHAAALLMTLAAIVMLSKKFGYLVDHGISLLGAPKALGGVLIALLVLAPEGLAAFRAAAENHLQRAVNIALGSALATISLTVPAVVAISLYLNMHLVLGLERAELVLLTLTLVISIITFSGPRTNVLGGIVHLVIFAVYIILIFDP